MWEYIMMHLIDRCNDLEDLNLELQDDYDELLEQELNEDIDFCCDDICDGIL